MKSKRIIVLVIVTILTLALAFCSWAASTKKAKSKVQAKQAVEVSEADSQKAAFEALKNAFPKLQVTTFGKSGIPGLYEIVAGQNVIYFQPESKALIFGEIMLADGRNLTQNRRDAMAAEKIKTLPLSKAVKQGSGSNIVIMFTDPDCPYCKKAQAFLTENKDKITQYTFFLPLRQLHPDAEAKSLYILGADDKGKAYDEIEKNAVKIDKSYQASQQAKILLAAHESAAGIAGVRGTPMLFINGKTVAGANIPMMQGMLGIKDKQ